MIEDLMAIITPNTPAPADYQTALDSLQYQGLGLYFSSLSSSWVGYQDDVVYLRIMLSNQLTPIDNK